MRICAGILLLIAAFSLALGLTQPLLQLERLFFLTDRPSLITMVSQLWSAGDMGLAILIAVVSIVFPCAKLLGLGAMLASDDMADHHAKRFSAIIGTLSKWSMLDVMLVAIAVFAAKTSGLATAFTLPGLWFFALSTITGAIAASLVAKSMRRQNAKSPAGGPG